MVVPGPLKGGLPLHGRIRGIWGCEIGCPNGAIMCIPADMGIPGIRYEAIKKGCFGNNTSGPSWSGMAKSNTPKCSGCTRVSSGALDAPHARTPRSTYVVAPRPLKGELPLHRVCR